MLPHLFLLLSLANLAAGSVDQPTTNAGSRYAFIKFDLPDCPTCKALQPVWEQLQTEYPGLLSHVDCAADPDFCSRNGIAVAADGSAKPAEPVLKWWSGQAFRRYKGAHSLEDLRAYVERKLIAESRLERERLSAMSPHTDQQGAMAAAQLAESFAGMEYWILGNLAALAAFLWALRAWIRHLGSTAEEPAGWLLAVATNTDAAALSGMFFFRVHPAKGTLTLVSWVRMVNTEVECLAAEPAPPSVSTSRQRPCFVIHAAATERAVAKRPGDAVSRGAVLSLQFDPRQTPAVEVVGFTELPTTCCTGLALMRRSLGGVAAFACTVEGKVLALSHALGVVSVGWGSYLLGRAKRRQRTGAFAIHSQLPLTDVAGKQAVPLEPPFDMLTFGGVADGASGLLVADASAKRLLSFARNETSGAAAASSEPWCCRSSTLGKSSSPRKLVLHPGGQHCYALSEVDRTLVICALRPNEAPKSVQTLSLTPAGVSVAAPAAMFGSAICATADGRYVYAALGSTRTLAVLRVVEQGRRLEAVQWVRIGEQHACIPSDLALVGDSQELLLMADGCADELVAFKRDGRSGALSKLGAAHCPSPKCMLPLQWPPQASPQL